MSPPTDLQKQKAYALAERFADDFASTHHLETAYAAGYLAAIAAAEKLVRALEHYECSHYETRGFPCAHDKTASNALAEWNGDL